MRSDKVITSLSEEFNLPSIKRRYFSMLIDTFLVLGVILGLLALFDISGNTRDYVRGGVILLVVLLYEPIFISSNCTLGQWVMNIRVRRLTNANRRLNIFHAVLRLIVKGLLGWISLLFISFNDDRRAIHDFAAGSVVIVPDEG